MYYGIAEMAKSNNLKLYEYFQYVLERMLLCLDDKPEEHISDLAHGQISCRKAVRNETSD